MSSKLGLTIEKFTISNKLEKTSIYFEAIQTISFSFISLWISISIYSTIEHSRVYI